MEVRRLTWVQVLLTKTEADNESEDGVKPVPWDKRTYKGHPTHQAGRQEENLTTTIFVRQDSKHHIPNKPTEEHDGVSQKSQDRFATNQTPLLTQKNINKYNN